MYHQTTKASIIGNRLQKKLWGIDSNVAYATDHTQLGCIHILWTTKKFHDKYVQKK